MLCFRYGPGAVCLNEKTRGRRQAEPAGNAESRGLKSLGFGCGFFAAEQPRALGAAAFFFCANGFGVDQPLGRPAAARIFLFGSGEATNTEKAAYFGAGSIQVGGGFLSGEPAIGRRAHFEKSSSAAGPCAVIHSNGVVSFLATTSAKEAPLDWR
jgi:hypothetical protein